VNLASIIKRINIIPANNRDHATWVNWLFLRSFCGALGSLQDFGFNNSTAEDFSFSQPLRKSIKIINKTQLHQSLQINN
jgi:hypothetical protein